jgi:apolipoprotein N-acyltransferase
LKQLSGEYYGTNQFVLITPSGDIAWNYLKVHPVPIIESNIQPGTNSLPTYKSQYGMLGGAICFDLDYPNYILEAGRKQVKILLQPSWTWGALSSRHFEGNAVRAVENGFTLLRCSSDGESGVVGPRGQFLSRVFTGSNPAEAVSLALPLASRAPTLYVAVGFIFEQMILAIAIVIYVVLLLPNAILHRISHFCDSAAVETDSNGFSKENSGNPYDYSALGQHYQSQITTTTEY